MGVNVSSPRLHSDRGGQRRTAVVRSGDRIGLPYLRPSSATPPPHTTPARRCGPSTRKGTTPPHHRTHPRCQRDRPAQDNSAPQDTLSHRAHPSGAPTTTTTAVHGSRVAARQTGKARRPRHALLPAVLLSADLPVHRPPHNFTIRFPTQESRATVKLIGLAIALVFGRDGARDCTRGQHFLERTISNRAKPPTWCREPA